MSDSCKTTIEDLNKGALPPFPPAPPAPPPAVVLAPNGVSNGKDCAGAELPTVPTHATVKTIPDPDAVQPVRLCGPLVNLKIEFSETLLYSASTEVSAVRVREYNEDTGLWEIRYENLDGTPFTGALPADLTAVAAQINVTRTTNAGCANNVPYIMRETARFDAETGALESEVVDWVDSAGVVTTTAPAGFVLGGCPQQIQQRKVLIYLERNGSTITMGDIVAATGTSQVQSVTVKQIQGTGDVKGDSGSGVPLSQGETWSWSAITGADALDMLGASALTMDAGGGEQRITATYIP